MQAGCHTVEYFGGQDLNATKTATSRYPSMINKFDESILCNNGGIYEILIGGVYGYANLLLLFMAFVLAPFMIIKDSKIDYFIEFTATLAKLTLVLIAKQVLPLDGFHNAVSAAFAITFQFIVFLIFR